MFMTSETLTLVYSMRLPPPLPLEMCNTHSRVYVKILVSNLTDEDMSLFMNDETEDLLVESSLRFT